MHNPVATAIDWVTTNDSTKAATGIAVFSVTGVAAMGWMFKKFNQLATENNEMIHEFNEKYANKTSIFDQVR